MGGPVILRRCLLACAVLCFSACTQEPIVGVLRPSSGAAQAYGRAVGNGIAVALDQASTVVRLPPGFEVIDVDTASDPEIAVAQYRRLVEESRVRFVVGGMTSSEADALLPVVDDSRVICLSPTASAKGLSGKSRLFFRLCATDEAEGRTAARHLSDRLGVRKLQVYTDDSALTRGVEAEFRQHFEMAFGGEIVNTIHVESEIWKQRSVDSLHANHPQAVFVVGHAERILEVLEHLTAAGFDGVRVTTSSFYLADVVQRAGEAAEGVVFPLSSYDARSLREPVAGFAGRYRERFGIEPDIFAAHGYDAMRVAMHTMATSEALYTADLEKFMSFNFSEFPGVTGPIAFDDFGDVKRYPVMHCVRRGRVMGCEALRKQMVDELKETINGLTKSKRQGGSARTVLST